MNTRKSFLIALLALSLAGPSSRATTVGLSSDSVNPVYAEQKQSEWCWAACIQMIANLYGADLTQDEVVARSYGPNVNRAGSLEVITASLNGSGTTRSGRAYSITSTMLDQRDAPGGAGRGTRLRATPSCWRADAGGSGHAVVCTAVSYDGPASNPTVIASLTVRDPWPSRENRNSTGRRVVSGADLGPRIMEGWVIHIVVHDTDGGGGSRHAAGLHLQRPEREPEHRADAEPRSQHGAEHPAGRRCRAPARAARSNEDDDEEDADEVAESLRRPILEARDLLDQFTALLSLDRRGRVVSGLCGHWLHWSLASVVTALCRRVCICSPGRGARE